MSEITNCPDCAVEPGVRHQDGCDVARCTATGEQHLGCPGELHAHDGREYGEHEGRCQPEIWGGRWPGELECEEFGLFVTKESVIGPPWFIKCGPDHPDRRADLNELSRMACTGELEWNGERWIKP